MEPLAVALKLKRGETPIVAKEVLDVAKDIAKTAGNGKSIQQPTDLTAP